ncbi:ribosomal protein S18 [Caldicellulosiruptor acetigenus I77R1B]|uniref:Small ribosomal subunit protein bS18 n=2 Tax=Caldicellulosiruptor acetigenus TaxID=301953 RepID=G2PUH3_9FIRM|nr:30S ribosomal protein S18 [Caldicellulosiruptor acetigenus]ADQ40038.1 ribosomal protein S18 [Caldicellulosiruptor acetigenus I77R1B]AEM74446.1 30S ribosomal protein S18 [Caldicellulosiruptor acetigenus 6A]
MNNNQNQQQAQAVQMVERVSSRQKKKKRVCSFCVERIYEIDYKDVNRLKKFLTERGKIMPRRTTGNCARHQRQLTRAIKRARILALLPFIVE